MIVENDTFDIPLLDGSCAEVQLGEMEREIQPLEDSRTELMFQLGLRVMWSSIQGGEKHCAGEYWAPQDFWRKVLRPSSNTSRTDRVERATNDSRHSTTSLRI